MRSPRPTGRARDPPRPNAEHPAETRREPPMRRRTRRPTVDASGVRGPAAQKVTHGGTTRHRSVRPAKRPRLRRVPRHRRLVVPPATLRAVRPCRLLRLVAVAACQPPCRRPATPDRPELRARRGLVLGLRDRGVPRGSRARSTATSPARPARARTRRARATGLGAAATLTRRSGASEALRHQLRHDFPDHGPAAPERCPRPRADPDDRP
jgi:hypothetical protein